MRQRSGRRLSGWQLIALMFTQSLQEETAQLASVRTTLTQRVQQVEASAAALSRRETECRELEHELAQRTVHLLQEAEHQRGALATSAAETEARVKELAHAQEALARERADHTERMRSEVCVLVVTWRGARPA